MIFLLVFVYFVSIVGRSFIFISWCCATFLSQEPSELNVGFLAMTPAVLHHKNEGLDAYRNSNTIDSDLLLQQQQQQQQDLPEIETYVPSGI